MTNLANSPNVKFSRTPGKVTHSGNKLGEHSDDTLSTYLELDEATRQQLRQNEIIQQSKSVSMTKSLDTLFSINNCKSLG